jgi:8-oxo-dGTP diphosphatase
VTIVVSAAVIERDGRYLVTRRIKGSHLEGLWEFPGGKCGEGESLVECLRREIVEELGTGAIVGDEMFHVTHHYPERSVTLHFFSCALAGDPRPLIGQEMQWVARADLRSLKFPPADERLIDLLVGQT